MRLPTSTPTTDHIRLCGCSATPKPYQRSIRLCCMRSAPLECVELEVEAPVENEVTSRDQQASKQESVAQRVLAIAQRTNENAGEGGRHKAPEGPKQHEGRDAGEDEPPRAQLESA